MEPRKHLKRFIERPRHAADLSEEARARIDARRIAKFTRSAHRNDQDHLTPSQLAARDSARLKAFERRRGRG